ncbi:MAG TPA: LysR family transcriptional regulator [Ornithinimicrobium sp.]|uniref:LysR family transcriptional regulator n=1 Tax=Ornithinimicrobium sp. TaxID=1977084 RepID=UPI002B4AAA87|nr:LysR family transcriptional regulator [Ornithinimicrobium sp.]HKJ12408.1 LysR family transcriptional regulator [Ornithinimicrobium sp.]
MELNLRRLRILREVALEGGVTSAAEAMQYSASGVSQQIAALEREIGAPLLEKHGRGVRFTDIGRVLLEHAEILLSAEQQAISAVEAARDSLAVELKVGVFCTMAAHLVPLIVEDLARRHPQVQVRTHEIDPDDAAGALRHGHLDLSFILEYPDAPEPWAPGLTFTPLGMDQLHLAAPAGWFSGSHVDIADLADVDWVMSGTRNYYGRALRQACRQAGFDPRVVHDVDEQPTALAMVAAGLGVTLMSDLGRSFLPASGVDVVALRQSVRRQVLMAHSHTTTGRPAVSAFLASARRAWAVAGLPRLEGPRRQAE